MESQENINNSFQMSYHSINEQIAKLVAEYKSTRSDDSFEELYALTHHAAYRYALFYMKAEDKADDILQKSYLQMSMSIDKLKDNYKFGSCLRRCIYFQSMNELKSLKKCAFSFSDLIYCNDNINERLIDVPNNQFSFDPELQVRYDDYCENQEYIMNQVLSAKQKEIYLMSSQYKIKEIAEMLNIPEGTVKSSLNATRKRVAQAADNVICKLLQLINNLILSCLASYW
ncbi:MAG: RNA polymerase sigma factor [Clostridiales bacterium]|nr:RNA polymerase sigma factor [Clostridiales bacterium]